MFRRILVPAICAMLACQPVLAREVTTPTWVEHDVAWTETTVVEVEERSSERIAGLPRAEVRGVASFGPFEVLDGSRAALVAETDSYSPADFRKMLRTFPGIRTLKCPTAPARSTTTPTCASVA